MQDSGFSVQGSRCPRSFCQPRNPSTVDPTMSMKEQKAGVGLGVLRKPLYRTLGFSSRSLVFATVPGWGCRIPRPQDCETSSELDQQSPESSSLDLAVLLVPAFCSTSRSQSSPSTLGPQRSIFRHGSFRKCPETFQGPVKQILQILGPNSSRPLRRLPKL